MLLFGKRQYIFYKKKINMRNYLIGKERLLVAALAFILLKGTERSVYKALCLNIG